MKLYQKVSAVAVLVGAMAGSVALADHAWGPYHWARTANPFVLKLGDNVSFAWDAYLVGASSDWSQSSVLDTTVVPGSTKPQVCRAKSGQVEVCNAKYGNNGWLGIAQIWITGGEHIAQGVVKLNDTYFAAGWTYNTPAWRRLVMCQEVAHTFGLDHQDIIFNNANLGSCMDYTNDPDGGAGGVVSDDPSNEYANAHDFAQLEAIYAHPDGFTTVSASALTRSNGQGRSGAFAADDFENAADWGRAIRHDGNGNPSLYERDFGGGKKVFTHVFWTLEK